MRSNSFSLIVKKMNGKEYTIILTELRTGKIVEEKALGILIKTTNLRRNMYGDAFDYTGRFLSNSNFNIKNNNQVLKDGESKYALELEYDFAEQGNNKLINSYSHRSFLVKKIR